MSIISKVVDAAKAFGKFVIGDKDQKLEDPLGELETERVAQEVQDRRRDRKNRGHGNSR